MEGFEEKIKEARRLYNNGKWKEAADILDPIVYSSEADKLSSKEQSELYRLHGWCYYYLGKKNIEDPETAGDMAVRSWEQVGMLEISEGDVSSVLSGLPLVYQYLLKDTKKAVEFAKEAVERADGSQKKAVALNTKGLVEKDGGLIIESLQSFSEAYNQARLAPDFRTAGHALNNRARALMDLLPVIGPAKKELIGETETLFRLALDKYEEHEETTGESTKFHKEGVKQRLRELKESH